MEIYKKCWKVDIKICNQCWKNKTQGILSQPENDEFNYTCTKLFFDSLVDPDVKYIKSTRYPVPDGCYYKLEQLLRQEDLYDAK